MTFLFPQASKSYYDAAQSEWGQKIPVLYEIFQVIEHIKPKTVIYKTSLTMLLYCRRSNRSAWPVTVPGTPLATGLSGGMAAVRSLLGLLWRCGDRAPLRAPFCTQPSGGRKVAKPRSRAFTCRPTLAPTRCFRPSISATLPISATGSRDVSSREPGTGRSVPGREAGTGQNR